MKDRDADGAAYVPLLGRRLTCDTLHVALFVGRKLRPALDGEGRPIELPADADVRDLIRSVEGPGRYRVSARDPETNNYLAHGDHVVKPEGAEEPRPPELPPTARPDPPVPRPEPRPVEPPVEPMPVYPAPSAWHSTPTPIHAPYPSLPERRRDDTYQRDLIRQMRDENAQLRGRLSAAEAEVYDVRHEARRAREDGAREERARVEEVQRELLALRVKHSYVSTCLELRDEQIERLDKEVAKLQSEVKRLRAVADEHRRAADKPAMSWMETLSQADQMFDVFDRVAERFKDKG